MNYHRLAVSAVITACFRRGWAMVLAGVAMVVASGLHAQTPFNYVYGGTCYDQGYSGVTPVNINGCAGTDSGYIAVGYSRGGTNCTGNADALVVRTRQDGSTLWARTYDINGGGGVDTAFSIKQLNDGFIVVGATGTPSNVFLMRLECDGSVRWIRTYNASTTGNSQDAGYDVTIATQGNSNFGTSPGDFIVAGTSDARLAGDRDALLMRVTSTGNLIWVSEYDLGNGAMEILASVIESQVPNGVYSGDVIAAGIADNVPGLGTQALGMRVNGNTGAITSLPPGGVYGIATYGGPGMEQFLSVKELTVAPNVGNLVFVGVTSALGGSPINTDIYVLKTAPAPCLRIMDRIIGDCVLGPTNLREFAKDVVEVKNPVGPIAVGDLALTGDGTPVPTPSGSTAATDAFLLGVRVSNLTPTMGRVYGDYAQTTTQLQTDEGHSITEDRQQGFVICGLSTSNLRRTCPAKPRDLYLIRTAGASTAPDCFLPYSPITATPSWSPSCANPPRVQLMRPPSTYTAVLGSVEGVSVCSGKPIPQCFGKGALPESGAGIASSEGSLSLRSYPNPVKRGEPVMVECTASFSGTVEVSVSSMLGGAMASTTAEVKEGTPFAIPVSTAGWPAGSYLVVIRHGEVARSVGVVVTQ